MARFGTKQIRKFMVSTQVIPGKKGKPAKVVIIKR